MSSIEPVAYRMSHRPLASRPSGGDGVLFLSFAGRLRLADCPEFDNDLIDALRHCRRLEVDLSRVLEIDRYGRHLLVLLRRVANREVRIVGATPAIELALGLPCPPPFAALEI